MPFQPASDALERPYQRKPGVAEDSARSGVAGLVQGAIGLGSLPGDVNALMTQGAAWAAKKLGVPEEDVAEWERRQTIARRFGNPLMGGGGTSGENLAAAAKLVPDVDYQPQTTAGEYARTLGQFAPGGAAPGSLVARALRVVVPAGATETAGQLTRKVAPKAEPAVRLATALASSAATGAATGPRGDVRIMANATRNVTPQQAAAAQALMQEGQARGVRLTLAEALQKVTGGATGMGGVQRYVEMTPKGREIVGPVMAQRPAQVRRAAQAVIDRLAPAADPKTIGTRGQRAATGALRQAEEARTAAVSPSYKAAGPQMVDSAELDAILNDIRLQAGADKTGLISPRLNEIAGRIRPEGANRPILDVENLDRIRKYYRDKVSLPPGSADALNREEAGAVGNILQRLDDLLERVPEFKTGKTQYEQLSRDVVEPALAGPLGDISRTADRTTMARALYPNAPPEGQPTITAETLRALAGQDPAIGVDLTRTHLAQRLGETTKDLQSGPNQWGGARFAVDVAGNPIQEEALLRGIGEVGGNPTDTSRLLDVLRATGAREHAGSPTAQNLQMADDMRSGVNFAGNLAVSTWPGRLFDKGQKFLDNVATELNAKRLAQSLMIPEDQVVAYLQRVQSLAPEGSPARRALLQALVAGNAENPDER